jgi:hypothetical protein
VLRRLGFPAATLAVSLAGAATAVTASASPNANSQHGQCTSAAAGKHLGWAKQADGGRNIGGTCEGPS